MDELIKRNIGTVVRALLGGFIGTLATNGYIDSSVVEMLLAGVAGAGLLAWGFIKNKLHLS